MTAGAGAFGLNITIASIFIQCEIWWNLNVEWQAICRVWRQKQESKVIAIQLFASNSDIDHGILKIQARKAAVTSELMEPIVRRPDEGPEILPLYFPQVVAPLTYDEYAD